MTIHNIHQAFPSKTNDLTNRWDPNRYSGFSVGLGVIVIEWYFVITWFLELEPNHQMQSSVVPKTLIFREVSYPAYSQPYQSKTDGFKDGSESILLFNLCKAVVYLE